MVMSVRKAGKAVDASVQSMFTTSLRVEKPTSTKAPQVAAEVTIPKMGERPAQSRNSTPNRVRCLSYPATGTLYKKNPLSERYGMPKSWFTDRVEYLFEGKMLYGSRDYDTVLKYIYGDYMRLPDSKGREQHSPFSEIVFPKE